MKELSENDKAIDIVRQMVADGQVSQDVAEKYFPELAGSEDERIRKALIFHFQDDGCLCNKEGNISNTDIIAWLEKQKIDPRQKHLNALLVADDIYQMLMNDEMVAEAESKAVDALMKLCITKHLLEKQGEKNTAWSEEDEEIRNNCIYWLEKARKYFEKDEDLIYDKKWIVKCTDWLKNRVFPQLKQEWSEEDEKILSDIIKDLVHPWNEYIPDRIEDEIKWLKNRLKSIRPQSTWKPSEEMLEALDIAIRAGIQLGSWEEKALRELQKQLKAL